MTLLSLITGVLLLFAGRRLFWIAVACTGFIAAYRFAQVAGIPGPDWMIWAVPVGVGLIGALLALFFQKVAVVLVGFVAGELITMNMVQVFGIEPASLFWIIPLAGGVVGAIAMLIVFDWALIVLSSLVGASVIVPSAGLDSFQGNIAFVILVILGLVVQTMFFLKIRNRSHSR